MTPKEAIASLKTLCNTCTMFPRCVNNKPECFQAIETAISALEKQKPVKVDSEWDRYYGKNNPCCGACGAYVDEYSKYCKRCGRPIDWGD